MDRAEHMQWCKDRAMEYVKEGKTGEAFTSMVSDLGKHPETAEHPAIMIGMALLMTGEINSVTAMGKFINGFN